MNQILSRPVRTMLFGLTVLAAVGCSGTKTERPENPTPKPSQADMMGAGQQSTGLGDLSDPAASKNLPNIKIEDAK